MDFTVISLKKIKITLCEDELKASGISTERFDYHSVEGKRALWHMLDVAKRETGFDAANAPLYVEVYPSRLGGCEVFVTKLDESTQKQSDTKKQTYVFSFADMETLLAASSALLIAGYREDASVYRLCGVYYLTVEAEAVCEEITLLDLLKEFGNREGDGAALYLRASGELLCRERAVACYGSVIRHAL